MDLAMNAYNFFL